MPNAHLSRVDMASEKNLRLEHGTVGLVIASVEQSRGRGFS